MMFPLFPLDVFEPAVGQVLGVLCGMAFGFVLERAGFGRAANLAAQFYGRDNRVLKVMFTGIATTATLLGLLGAVGLLDLSLVTVPETFLGPQIVGGLLLGIGFVVAGYCPGTGVVAAASGSVDGMISYLGVMVGTLVFGLGYSRIQGFYESGSMGRIRLDQWLGLPFPVVAIGVVALAVVAFLAVERLEARLAGAEGAPDRAPRLRNLSLVVVTTLALVALVPSAVGTASAESGAATVPTIDAVALADRMVTSGRALWILDLRDPAACAKATVPGAVCRAADEEVEAAIAALPTSRTLILVAEPGAPLPDAALRWEGDVRLLDGGYPAFAANVLTAPSLPADPTLAQVATYQRRAALHGYFTGSAPVAAPTPVKRAAPGPAAKKGGGC